MITLLRLAMPSGSCSEKLLLRLGFIKEGIAKEYLRIHDKWEDHVLTSKMNQAW